MPKETQRRVYTSKTKRANLIRKAFQLKKVITAVSNIITDKTLVKVDVPVTPEIGNAFACSKCEIAMRTHLFAPCGHLGLCASCAKSWDVGVCSICKSDYYLIVKVIF